MNKRYQPQDHEQKIYQLWEQSGAFKPAKSEAESDSGQPYTILMPPPNANASLHSGHAMYSVDDIIIRFKRMQGYSALWQPGMDHAGFETQYVYEKHLRKQGKSRLDFDRQTLYQNVYDFVKENSGLIFKQFRRLGFSADWSRSVFTLDPHVLKQAFSTFQKMEKSGYVYRDDYIVNYCTHCGTSLAELEIEYTEKTDPFIYMKYGPFTIGTVRPETKFRDTALAVNPKDKRYKKYIGQTLEIMGLLGPVKMTVIPDEDVDMEFGTGIMKVTPAHDPHDFELGKKFNLPVTPIIDLTGRMDFSWFLEKPNIEPKYRSRAEKYHRQKVANIRTMMIEDLKKDGLLVKVDEKYTHRVGTCYKCKRVLEPMVVPNWFIKVKKLKKPVIKAVKENKIKFFPARNKKRMLQWLEKMHDWPISRQIVWGIRIPVWYSTKQNPEMVATFITQKSKAESDSGETKSDTIKNLIKAGHTLKEIESGLQALNAPINAKYKVSNKKPGPEYLPETDTFDTWFSSGQWPLVTLKKSEYQTRLPTDLMGTYVDILEFWISRMIMFSLYLENKIPYKNVYLWSVVADKHGVKMSKSKGNVVNPMEFVDKYGADALRFSLMYGIPAGSKVILSEDKVRGMRNFANKLWNIGRFLEMSFGQLPESKHLGGGTPSKNTNKSDSSEVNGKTNMVPWYTDKLPGLKKTDKTIIKKLNTTIKKTTKYLDEFKLNEAAQLLYDFIWHDLADKYIEAVKPRLLKNEKTKKRKNDTTALSVLRHVYLNSLKLLHPFMPFVTETLWQELKHLRKYPDQLLITSQWPTTTNIK